MKINDANIQAFAMALCHQMDVDPDNVKGIQGTYVLVLQSQSILKEVGLKCEEMDSVWREMLAYSLISLLNARGLPLPPDKQDNINKMVDNAVATICENEGFYMATTMADVMELRRIKEEYNL